MGVKVEIVELFIVWSSHQFKQKAHGPTQWPKYSANESKLIKRIERIVMYTKQRVGLHVPNTILKLNVLHNDPSIVQT